MFDFSTSRQRPRRHSSHEEPSREARGGIPTQLALTATFIVMLTAIVFVDEANQYDPVRERERLERTLESIQGTRKEVTARKERILALDKQADSDPAVIHNERLPPFWQLPATYSTVEEWHTAARRRSKRADEELKSLAEREAQTKAEIANLPPPDAKRVSMVRRMLNAILGEMPPRTED